MLHRNIFVPHGLRLVFCIDKYFIQIISYIHLATFHFGPFVNQSLHLRPKNGRVNLHLLQELRQQAILYRHHTIKEMLLCNFLIPKIISNLLQIIENLN